MYVEGVVLPISVYTDHKNLEYFSTTRSTSRRHARWAASLSTYNYTISYRKGASNGKPDALWEQGHAGMEAIVGEERGQGCGRMSRVVVAEFCHVEEACPICLLIVALDPKVLL